MNNIVYIIRVEILTPTGTQQLQAIKVFQSSHAANMYQDSINNDPIYKNINAFAFSEPAIFIEDND